MNFIPTTSWRFFGGAFSLALAGLLASSAAAHDFWLEPSSFRPQVGEAIKLSLYVGHGFEDAAGFPRDPQHLRKFATVSAKGEERPVTGLDGARPAGVALFSEPGIQVAGYRSSRNFISLDAAKFESYLVEEGFEHVAALRAERGETGKPGREAYSRCAKTVVEVQPAPGEAPPQAANGYDQPAGLRYEIIPEANPCRLSVGDALPVRVLFEGQPAAGALVRATPKAEASAAVSAKTDAEGRAVLRLERPGLWLIRSVRMIEAEEGLDAADWESLWASLTLAVDEPAAPPPANAE